MPFYSRPKRLWLFIIAIACALVIILVDWRFIVRAVTYPDQPIMAVDWYQPQALVAGQPLDPLPISESSQSPQFEEALQQISRYAAERNSTGLLVMHRGKIVLEQYWQGYDETSAFNAMSMSKSIVGVLIGQAIAEGFITSLDDPAAQYLPEWRQDDRATMTLRDLIDMQSGLRNERSTTSVTSDLVQLYMGSDIEKTALNIPLVNAPGEAFSYNNVNSQVLAIVLQRATGMSYADYLSSRLWQPLRAGNAGVWLDRPNGSAKTFCCLFATVRDWARVGQMLLSQGRFNDIQIVPAEWIQDMLIPSPLEDTFGKHIWVKARIPGLANVEQAATVPYLAGDTFYLDGRDLQRVFIVPSQSLVIVRAGEHPPTWDDSVIPNTLVKALTNS
ncbi:serine hydrolase domain-containing protein [Oscillatoria sp. CS-180]|uniref:serine hydrolase domain-containing protein n=1 Tax=Oscillatoria sp. CS-180 TaxID=3021720 RepID=UPI00232F793F|nr:serine hydrolase [Oscillatoria sp. CS-180]